MKVLNLVKLVPLNCTVSVISRTGGHDQIAFTGHPLDLPFYLQDRCIRAVYATVSGLTIHVVGQVYSPDTDYEPLPFS